MTTPIFKYCDENRTLHVKGLQKWYFSLKTVVIKNNNKQISFGHILRGWLLFMS